MANCTHPTDDFRRVPYGYDKTRFHVTRQCLTCGTQIGQWITQDDRLPPVLTIPWFDTDLARRWEQRDQPSLL